MCVSQHELKKHTTDDKDFNNTEWDSKEEIILGVLKMYCQNSEMSFKMSQVHFAISVFIL